MHENRETSEVPAAKYGGRTAGEGGSRTARAYIFEESDSGIIPMNRSNKDGKPYAENEEGRPLIKENTHQPSTYPTQSEKRVSQGLAGVRKAAKENGSTALFVGNRAVEKHAPWKSPRAGLFRCTWKSHRGGGISSFPTAPSAAASFFGFHTQKQE